MIYPLGDQRVQDDAARSANTSTSAPTRFVRADMHVHSTASDKPVLPIFGLIDAPECLSEPEQVYDQARARGMDLVAITDHDEIWGALQLVERGFENILVGQEVSVRFREGGHPVHVLVWGITPDQHEQIATLGLRIDIVRFAHWVREQNLVHAVAHPIDGIGGGRSLARLERLALLFRGFELLNGAHPGGHMPTVRRWLDSLSPVRLDALAARHGIAPVWPDAHVKYVTAGSDDHGLLNIGRTWAGVPLRDWETSLRPAEFLERIRAGEAKVGGQAGHSALMAHQFMAVGLRRFAGDASKPLPPRVRYALRPAARLAGVTIPRPSPVSLVIDAARATLRHRRTSIGRELQAAWKSTLAAHPEVAAAVDKRADPLEPALADHERASRFIDSALERMMRVLCIHAQRAVETQDWRSLKNTWRVARALVLAQAPYLVSLGVQNKERSAMLRMEHENAPDGEGPLARQPRVLLFTDTFADVNGVSRFIRDIGHRAHATGCDLRIFTSTEKAMPDVAVARNFQPIHAITMPKYPELDLAVPPVIRMLREADALQPDVIHVSTPGPVGAVGILASMLLRRPVLGVYHTDFPAYIERLFKSESMGRQCARAMGLFYKRFHTVFARSDAYRENVGRLGVPQSRIRTFRSGIDIDAFHPRHRDVEVWRRLAGPHGKPVPSWAVKVLYCGRVSVEKNTPLLEQIWPDIRARAEARGIEAQLIVVGDGPDRTRLEESMKRQHVTFLGFRHGEELSQIYASCDVFVFPSLTDTLGQVVMESQASGLPAVVSDVGGPSTIVRDGETGYVVSASSMEDWKRAVTDLVCDAKRRSVMGREAHRMMAERGFGASFDAFWQAHTDAYTDNLAAIGIRDAVRTNGRPTRAQNRRIGTSAAS
jgi:glycosyltransferase involved in cell wall biosynthesis